MHPDSTFPAIKADKRLYSNPLATPGDIADFVAEGQPLTSFPRGCLRLENGMDPKEGQAANFLFWCPETLPADLVVRWRFRPVREPGLAMFWWSAAGRDGQDLFDPSLPARSGPYRQYHSGAINGYHLSYFRRKNPDERGFHTCNLRKSHGFHLVTQGADPIPDVIDVDRAYALELAVSNGWVRFSIDELPVLWWRDDGETYGPRLGPGHIGFRQMAPMIAEYSDLEVFAAVPVKS